jgi:hypothetical protein
MSGGFSTVPLGSGPRDKLVGPSMLGVYAAAALTKRNAMTTRTPARDQHCRSTSYRFIGTSLHDGGEIAEQSGWVASYTGIE